jgi:hypothetical protein
LLGGVFAEQTAGFVIGVVQRAGGHLVSGATFTDALLQAVVEVADGLGGAGEIVYLVSTR